MELKVEEISENQNLNKKKTKNNISYDTILENMGMTLIDNKLVFYNKNYNNNISDYSNQNQSQSQNIYSNSNINFYQQQPKQPIQPKQPMQNSYIYNKYFKNEINNNIEQPKPKSIKEYKLMLIKNIIEKEKIKRIKTKKLSYYSNLPYVDNVRPNVRPYKKNENKLGKMFPHNL